MEDLKVLAINRFINECYNCLSFNDFLKLAIMKLHGLIKYDSGMFFCSISKDCSFFKPYIDGNINDYYKKSSFDNKDAYIAAEDSGLGTEAYVYKAIDYKKGIVQVPDEPRRSFINEQSDFYIACFRIIYKGQFMGEIYLHRSKDKPDFDESDMFTLRLLQPHVSTVFNIIHTMNAVKYFEASGQTNTQKGICLFDSELTLTGGNASGIEMLKVTTKFGSSVLYHIKEICKEIDTENRRGDKGKAAITSAVIGVPGNNIKLEIFAREVGNNINGVKFIIIIEFADEKQKAQEYKYKFSKREAEVIDELIQGKNNLGIARTLNVSENTVKTHIKNIYKKTGINSRTELVYVLMLNGI